MLDPLIVTHSRKCGVVPADKRADEVAWHFDPRGNTSFGSSFNNHPAFLPLTFTSWFVVRLYLAIDLCPQWATDSSDESSSSRHHRKYLGDRDKYLFDTIFLTISPIFYYEKPQRNYLMNDKTNNDNEISTITDEECLINISFEKYNNSQFLLQIILRI